MHNSEVVRDLIANGFYLLTKHARERMAERNITHLDIRQCARHSIIDLKDDKYVVVGRDIDAELLKIICVYDDDVLIITVY